MGLTSRDKCMNKKHIIIGLVLLAIVAGGVFMVFNKKAGAPKQQFVSYKDPGLTTEEKAGFQKKLAELEGQLKDAKDDNSKFKLIMQIGIQHYALGEYALAQERYNAASKILPDNPTVWSELYVVENVMGDYVSARTHILKAIELNPASAQYWRWRIDIEKDHFSPAPAIVEDLYAQALSKTNENVEILAMQARYYESVNKVGAAIDVWKRLKVVDPSNTGVYDEEIKTLQTKPQ